MPIISSKNLTLYSYNKGNSLDNYFYIKSSPKQVKNSEYIQLHQSMGTIVSIKINVSELEGKKVAEKSIQLIDKIEQMMSFYNTSSQISHINYKAGQSWITVSPELFFVIEESKRYARLTKGVFDISVAALTALWQYYGKLEKVPPESLIEKTLKLVDYEGILLDEDNKKVKLERKEQKIELGGIAKGYAANRIIELYREMGIKSGIINLGGNVSLLGSRYDGAPWGVGIQNPNRDRDKCLGIVLLADTSVVTSGDYERFFQKGNRLFHHILDPYTGYPAKSELRSVTVIHPDSMLADVLATTIFILGMGKGVELIKHFGDVELIIVTDKRIYLSHNLVKKFHLIEKGFEIFQI